MLGTHTQVASSFEEEFEAINEKVRRKEREREGGGAGQQLGAQGPGEKKFSGIFKDSHTLPASARLPTPHTAAQRLNYTNILIHKPANMNIHKHTNTQTHKYTSVQIQKYTNS